MEAISYPKLGETMYTHICANGLTVNGVANPATLRKLVSSSAISKAEADKKEEAEKEPTYKTENLDWFKNGYKVFPKRAIIEIKDVRTGLVFKAQVLYGTNHLDAEPLTKADTATLLKINGGVDFSWRRRPMLVKYNGHVYASSIYSEPHGDQTITLKAPGKQGCVQAIPPVFLGEPAILALWENQWIRVFRSAKHISEFTSGFRARLDEIVDKEEREQPRIVNVDDGIGMSLEDKHTIVLDHTPEMDALQKAVDNAMNVEH